MKYIKQIEYIQINSNSPLTKEIINPVIKGISVNKRFFAKQPKIIKLFVCDKELDFKKGLGKYYQKWLTGFSKTDMTIHIKSPSLIQKIGMRKREEFAPIIIHEINHLNLNYNIKKWQPYWFVEGLAIYAADQYKLSKKEIKKIIDDYLVDEKILDYKFDKNKLGGHYPRYPIWGAFTRYLIKNFGRERILEFTKLLKNKTGKSNYEKSFKEIFKKSDTDIFRKFLDLNM
jgi:hypothetical protein